APPRPGATLWSIVAGPLVNVGLLPILLILVVLSRSLGWAQTMPNVHVLLFAVFVINLGLLLFNLLPNYPLDGGQIVRSLLWLLVWGCGCVVFFSFFLVGVFFFCFFFFFFFFFVKFLGQG